MLIVLLAKSFSFNPDASLVKSLSYTPQISLSEKLPLRT